MQYCEGDEDSDDEVNEESWCTCLSSHEVSISFVSVIVMLITVRLRLVINL